MRTFYAWIGLVTAAVAGLKADQGNAIGAIVAAVAAWFWIQCALHEKRDD